MSSAAPAGPSRFPAIARSVAVALPALFIPPASDLASHVYNAWLVRQVELGMTGFVLSPQITNVAVDWLLYWLLPLGPLVAAGIVNFLSVLIFFGGALAFFRATSGRAPWECVLLLAAFSYGILFWLGFCNLLMATGMAFFAQAFVLRRQWIASALSLLVALPMHLFGFALGAGACGLLLVHERLQGAARSRALATMLGAMLLALLIIHRELFVVWNWDQVLAALGTDQLYVFGYGSRWISYSLVALCIFLAWSHRGELRRIALTPAFALFVFFALMIALVPRSFLMPVQDTNVASSIPSVRVLSFLTERFTLVQAVLLVCLLAQLELRQWQKCLITAVAVSHFVFVITTARFLDTYQRHLNAVVQQLPQGARVVADLADPPFRYNLAGHALSLACVGHCFDYANYEPSSGHFRLHAKENNPYVLWRRNDVKDVEAGLYAVRKEDLPLFSIVYVNGDFRIHVLKAGEQVNLRMKYF